MRKNDLIEYYAWRAHEYDSIYTKPERQEDLMRLKQYLRDLLKGR